MRYIITALLTIISFPAFCQQARLSPLTQIFLLQREKQPTLLPPNYVYRKIGTETFVSAILKTNSHVDEASLRTLGVRIGTKAGNIWTTSVPVGSVASLPSVKGLEYIQLDEPIHPTLDNTRTLTRVDSVHEGLGNLSAPYHGTGVVLGIIDAGFDYRSPVLFDTTGSHYRVKRIWEQVKAGTPPSGFSYGNEIADTLAMWSEGQDMPISHGAHVAGIAGGSGYGSTGNRRFRGMADAADLVLVGITPPSTDWTSTGMGSIIDGLNYIYSYASAVGKPAIANLSWGCTIGPHDGLSLFSQACDQLTGSGKLFALSAGNNGTNSIHLQKTFTATDTVVRTFATFNSALGTNKTWVDIWGDSAQNFCVQLSLYNGVNRIDSTGYFCLDNQLHTTYTIGANGDTLFGIIVTSAAEFNGKPRVFLDIYNRAFENVMVSVKATSGTINMWSGYVQNTTGYYSNLASLGVPGAVNGNTNMTVGDMACTRSAITVGAYVSRPSFTNSSGGTVTLALASQNGNAASFSSKGPTADGRTKPDISAPGMAIGSTVSSYDPDFFVTGGNYSYVVEKYTDPVSSREHPFAMLMGTSMSSPVAAGILALMLEANPALSPQQAQIALAQTAITDVKTGTIPPQGSNTWGFGKINAMGAVQRAKTITGITNEKAYSKLRLYPNPTSDLLNIAFEAAAPSVATITIFDIAGRKLLEETVKTNNGSNTYSFSTKGWNRGVYLIRLKANTETRTERFVVQ